MVAKVHSELKFQPITTLTAHVEILLIENNPLIFVLLRQILCLHPYIYGSVFIFLVAVFRIGENFLEAEVHGKITTNRWVLEVERRWTQFLSAANFQVRGHVG